jgi:hypothetical protein
MIKTSPININSNNSNILNSHFNKDKITTLIKIITNVSKITIQIANQMSKLMNHLVLAINKIKSHQFKQRKFQVTT